MLEWIATIDPEQLLTATVFGFLANEAKQVTAFFFGSSQGSKQKTEVITEMIKNRHET